MFKPSAKSFFKYLFTAKVNPFKDPDKGTLGEARVFCRLDTIDVYHRLLTNIYLTKDNGEITEIDIVFITEKGVYVVESKNYSGWIFGDHKSYYWMQMFNKNSKYQFLNPIIQNKIHIQGFLKLCNMLQEKHISSYIVFGRDCELKKVDTDFENGKIVKIDDLIDTITEELKEKSTIFKPEMVDTIYNILKKYSKKDVKQEHIEKIQQKYNKND